MAERQSPLANLPRADAALSRVTLSEVAYASILQIRAWPATLVAVAPSLAAALSFENLPPLGSAFVQNGTVLAAPGPGRFLVASRAPDIFTRLQGLAASDAAVADISHGRTVLSIEGEGAPAVLSKCVAIDLDPSVFPAGRIAETAIHHIDVLIHRQNEMRFELWVLRSFAESLADWLLDMGTEENVGFARG